MVAFSFDARQFDPSTGGGSILESGTYAVQITNSEIKPTKNRDGHFLELTLAVIAGESAGRQIKDRLNIDNPNQTAKEIAYRQLAAISYVVGRVTWQDSQELHGIPFQIQVEKVARNDDPTKYSNNVLAYLDSNGRPASPNGAPAAPAAPAPSVAAPAPATPQQVAAPATPATAAPGGNPPWQPAAAPAVAPPAAAAPWQQPAAGGAPAAGDVPPWQR